MGKIINANLCPNELRPEWSDYFTVHEKWLIEYWGRTKGGKPNLEDIAERPFDTEPLALAEVARLIDEQKKDNENALDNYAERLKEFVMDETTDDREPAYPLLYNTKFIAKKYLVTLLPDGRYNTLIYDF